MSSRAGGLRSLSVRLGLSAPEPDVGMAVSVDRCDRVVDRFDELACRCLRQLPHSQPAHLAKLVEEFLLDLRPRLAGVGVRICVGLASIQFGGQRRGHRSGRHGIKAVPEPADELQALFGSQLLDGNGE